MPRRTRPRLIGVIALTAAACAVALSARPATSATGPRARVTGVATRVATRRLLGSTTVARHGTSVGAGRADAFPFRAASTGRVTVIGVYVGRQSRARQLVLGIYGQGRRGPGRRLVSARVSSPRRGRWNGVGVRATSVLAGHTYWLAVLALGGPLSIRDRTGRHCPAERSRGRIGSLPGRWRSGGRTGACAVAAYATGLAAVTTPPPPHKTPPPPPKPPVGSVPCALTHAAGANGTTSCWATHTGVQGTTGYTEAEIEAGAAGFAHTGDLSINTPGKVIDHYWIKGCVAVNADNVTIKDSLITPPDGDYCTSAANGSAASALNNGNSSGTPRGLLVEDTTVDGGNATGNQFGVSINEGECLRCNVFGFAKNYATGTNTAAHPAVFIDDYSHDLSLNSYSGNGSGSDCAHDNGWYMNSSTYILIEDSYSIMTGAADCTTGAITNLADYGAPSNMTVDHTYMEGDGGVDLYTGKAPICGTPAMVITDDAFSSDNGYNGTAYINSWTPKGNTWSGNHYAETGKPFNHPPADC